MPNLKQTLQIVRNMGWRYASFRLGFELEKRLGLFKRKFPAFPSPESFIDLVEWRKTFRFFGVSHNDIPENIPTTLPAIQPLRDGKALFFHAQEIDLGKEYDWITNPDTGFKYDIKKHWADIQDFSPTSGDIKYVWEKSRFSYLYDIIRHDHYTKEDHSKWVFDEIESWINANPINCGPNYKCSQEISLRILNWTYALNYYKASAHLTENLFHRIMHVIYWQIKHVYSNINFSRIAVRNNHAITETLTLYICGLLYPFFPEAGKWKKNGKRWFEQEIDYQIYNDGTFLQFSMNYHRVVIQLLTWAFQIAELFGERFNDNTYEKAYKSLRFLNACQDEQTGWLPNYGNNDGALFFKLNSCDYRDYRPQLNVLHILLTGKPLYGDGDWQEDTYWFNASKLAACDFPALSPQQGWHEFKIGGYYVLRDRESITFIRCGSHKDRPAQADNLHLDIWYQGANVLFDGGSYKYNTQPSVLKYFMGTESHNTVMLDDHDQMQKGPRFIWYNWSQAEGAKTGSDSESFEFEGTIQAFSYISKGIKHTRRVRKTKGKPEWIVEDEISGKPHGAAMKQIWHALDKIRIDCSDVNANPIILEAQKRWRSDYYGVKVESDQLVASTDTNKITARITIK